MEALIHFIIILIKISILGSVYATLTLLSFKIVGRFKPNSWADRVSKKKLRFWFLSGFLISIGLFLFTFTYYGDHGLGDYARVPIGNGRAINEINGTQAFIQDEGPISMIEIDNFIVTNKYVYGIMGERDGNYEGAYFVYDLVSNKVTTFIEKEEYHKFLKIKNLEIEPNYKNFRYYYKEYWLGWRNWFFA